MNVISVLNVDSARVVGVYLDKDIALANYSEESHIFTSHVLNEELYIPYKMEPISNSKIEISNESALLDNYLIMDACDVLRDGVLLKNSFETIKFIAEQYIEFNSKETVIIVSSEEYPNAFFLAKNTTSYDDDDSIEFDEFLLSRNIKIM